MVNFILIAICIFAGLLFRKYGKLPADAHKGLNAWIIYLALPAVSLKYLPHIYWSRELLFPAISPIIIWLLSWICVRWYATSRQLSKRSEGGLKLATGLSNTSFLGFPLVLAYFSEQDLGVAVICDQVTFLLLATAGIVVAIHSSKKQSLTTGLLLKRLLLFPPFIGCVVALTIPRFIDISVLDPVIDKLAITTGPLALFSIGLQLKLKGWMSEWKHISFSLVCKLILAPAIVLIIALLAGLKGRIPSVTVFEAAMPALLSAGVVADEYDLDPRLSNLITGIGILLCFGTTALWHVVIARFLG